ncbi:hypothetical protein [Solimonas flava]|uniref:hypothetical protein n=1 Tax=Solimonas flava TaxID=415849 RepID=UPI0012B60E84|nr:hypothetical protein [Solimonas flava]
MKDKLELTWEVDFGNPGVDDANDNPLARATDRLFRLGKPFTRLGKCFFMEPAGIVRWLGIFVHSAGDRTLFFPGDAAPNDYIRAVEHKSDRWNQPFQIDHLSLEPDWQSWHLTSGQSKEHLGKLATHKLDSERTFWFGMSVAAENLRVVKNTTRVIADTPVSDTDRRAEVFKQSREGAIFQMMTLNSGHQQIPPEGFLHFSVIVGSPGFPIGSGEILGLPHGGPFLAKPPLPPSEKVPSRLYRLVLSESVELEITVSAHAGPLSTNVVYSCAQSGTQAAK